MSNILIIKHGSLGDIVQISGVLNDIREKHINDKITMTGMGKMDIPVSDLGKPEDLMKLKSFDKLPYSVQKKTFIPLIELFNKNGYKSLKHWP